MKWTHYRFKTSKAICTTNWKWTKMWWLNWPCLDWYSTKLYRTCFTAQFNLWTLRVIILFCRRLSLRYHTIPFIRLSSSLSFGVYFFWGEVHCWSEWIMGSKCTAGRSRIHRLNHIHTEIQYLRWKGYEDVCDTQYCEKKNCSFSVSVLPVICVCIYVCVCAHQFNFSWANSPMIQKNVTYIQE